MLTVANILIAPPGVRRAGVVPIVKHRPEIACALADFPPLNAVGVVGVVSIHTRRLVYPGAACKL